MGLTNKFFVAYSGRLEKKWRKVTRLSKHLSVWNLSKFTQEELKEKLQHKVPLVVQLKSKVQYDFGFLSHDKPLAWGILVEDSYWSNQLSPESSFVFLCSLFSDVILNPLFVVDHLGVRKWGEIFDEGRIYTSLEKNRLERFSNPNFNDFYEWLKSESEYFYLVSDNEKNWINSTPTAKKEHYRMALACMLFRDLAQYDEGKQMYTYPREIADIGTIFELLLLKKSEEKAKSLIERSKILLDTGFPGIELEIGRLYKERSNFVHGSHYLQIAKEARLDVDGYPTFPSVDFNKLGNYRRYLRYALIAVLYLHKQIREGVVSEPSVYQFIKKCQKDPVKLKLLKGIVDPILGLLS